MVRLYRTFSNYIFTGEARCAECLCASSGWFKYMKPPRTFSNHIIAEIAICVELLEGAVLLEGEQLATFNVEQGVAQGCSLSPILFSVFINGLLKEVEQAELGIELSNGARIGGMLFADDFVGVSDSGEELQKLIDVVHAYCCKWRLKANVSKSAVMVFARDAVEGDWKWGENSLPKVCKYTYLGIVMGLGMRI